MKVHVTGLCKKTSKEITKSFDVIKESEARKLAKKSMKTILFTRIERDKTVVSAE
jgi:hypothetical protein